MGFARLPTNAASALAADYTAASGSLTVTPGSGARFLDPVDGAPTAGNPLYLTICRAGSVGTDDLTAQTVYKCTGRSGDTFTGVVAVDGTTDRNYSAGDAVLANWVGSHGRDLASAITSNTTQITALGNSWISLAYEGIDNTATVAVGSTNYGAVDSRAQIQALMNGGRVNIKCDVQASASGPLIFDSYTLWQNMPGCGLIQRPNSNTTQFTNRSWTYGLNTPVAQHSGTPASPGNFGNEGIRIKGGIFVGNGANQNNPSHDYPASSPVNCPLNFVRFAGVKDPWFEDVQILDFGGFNIWVFNFDHARVIGCHIDGTTSGYPLGTDCLHPNGPGRLFHSKGNILRGTDDCFAWNADDGGSNGGGLGGLGNAFPIPAPGNLQYMLSQDDYLDNHQRTAVRLLSVNSFLGDVVFQNLQGSAGAIAHSEIFPGTWLDTGKGNIGRVRFENCGLGVTGVHFDQQAGYFIGCNSALWEFIGCKRDTWSVNWPTIAYSSNDSATTVGQVVIDSYHQSDTANSGPLLSISRALGDCSISDVNLKYASQISNAIGLGSVATLGSLRINGMRADKLDYFLTTLAGSVCGPIAANGLIHTNSSQVGAASATFNFGAAAAALVVDGWASPSIANVYTGVAPTFYHAG